MGQSSASSGGEGWEVVSSDVHFQNEHVSVATEKIKSPTRRVPRGWIVAHRKRAVVIAAMTLDGKILLIRQERLPIQATIWEVPAGQIDDPKDQDLAAIKSIALRELHEETGFELVEGGELIPLGDYFTSPGFTDERGYFFLARPVSQSREGHAHDKWESILDCRAFSPRELVEMIAKNEIRDANTLSICARMMVQGVLNCDLTI